MEMEIAERYNVIQLNYSALESEHEALHTKVEELSASAATDKVTLANLQQ